MADEKPPGPMYIATKQIPKVEVPQNTLDAVLSEVRALRIENTERFDKLETTVDTLVEDGKIGNQRMTRLEVRMDGFEERGAKHSGGLTRASEVDAKHDAAIAMLHTKVDTLSTSLAANSENTVAIRRELVDGVKSFWKRNPKLETALVALIFTALGVAAALLQRLP